MSHILEDRILESTTTTGTGALALAGAVTGFRRFSAVCAVSDTAPYFIEAIDSLGQPTGDYEYGIGTYSAANTLTRTTVQGSSNAGAAVNFAAGSKNVGLSINASGFAKSLASSGYTKLPSGLILQWGTVSCPALYAANTAFAFNFPLAFPNAALQLIGGNSGANLATPGTQFSISSVTQGAVVWGASSATPGGLIATYFAIGN